MKAKKAINILHEWETKQSGYSFGMSEFEEAANEGKKLLCAGFGCAILLKLVYLTRR